MTDFRLLTAGDACIVVTVEDRIDPAAKARCAALRTRALGGA
jgi:hypothetical protein